MLQALLFDLDGTLIDTAPEIADALNRTLRWLGRPAVEPDVVRGWIGDGARALLGKALGHPADDTAWEYFSYEYNRACGTSSKLYPGTRAMLERLHAKGFRMAVLTNKESRFAHKLLSLHDITGHFDLLVAGDTLPFKKPDPRVIGHALAALDVPADEAALIGDSPTDIRTARAAGIRAWAVSHGYPQHGFADDEPDAWLTSFADFDPEVSSDAMRPIH
jgi:phosphoglycolate phosphatase